MSEPMEIHEEEEGGSKEPRHDTEMVEKRFASPSGMDEDDGGEYATAIQDHVYAKEEGSQGETTSVLAMEEVTL